MRGPSYPGEKYPDGTSPREGDAMICGRCGRPYILNGVNTLVPMTQEQLDSEEYAAIKQQIETFQATVALGNIQL